MLVLTQVTISRAERGEQLLSRDQVNVWVRRLTSDEEVQERIAALLVAAHAESLEWPKVDDAGHLQDVARGREAEASLIRNCQLNIIPGLLQTAAYARLVIPQMDPARSIDHAGAVAARIERQQILYGDGRRFEFLVGEQALHWSPGPGVLPGQFDRLASVATLSSVELRVLPVDREGAPAWHSFVLFTPADGDEPYVTTELVHGGQELRLAEYVAMYEELWKGLWSAAVPLAALRAGREA